MKRTPIRNRRSNPRPGRLGRQDLFKLRLDCWTRDFGRCQNCGCMTWFNADPISDVSYHMAHIKAKRIGGDSLDNVRTLCGGCHRAEHNAGGKPCPAKPSTFIV